MTQKFASLEAFSARTSAQPLYSGEWSARFSASIQLSTNPGSSLSIPYVLDQRPGAGQVVEVSGYLQDALGARVAISTISGVQGWVVEGAWLDNGSNEAIRADGSLGKGRVTPQYQLTIGGAARTAILAAFSPNTLVTAVVEVTYRPPRAFSGFWQGFQTFGLIGEYPPNATSVNQNINVNSVSPLIDGLLAKEFTRGGRTYNVAATNQTPSVIGECMFSAIDATGYVCVESSDIGLGAGQIPTSVADNLASRFVYHPNTFFRQQADKINGLACRYADPVGIATSQSDQPIGIYVNDEVVNECDWMFVIDGAPQIVHIDIANNISARTPRQVWERVLVPALQGSQAIARSVTFNASVKLNRLAYLSYARCLTRFGLPYVQDNVSPPA